MIPRDARILATFRRIAKSHKTYGRAEHVAICAHAHECDEADVWDLLRPARREHPGYSIGQTECGTVVDVEV